MDPIDLAIPMILIFYFYRYLWSLLFLSLTIGLCVYVKRLRRSNNTTKVHGHGRGVIITGCDTGIGHATARRLSKLGFTVFAGCLQPSGAGPQLLESEGLYVVHLDVTDDDSVNSALAFVENNYPEKGLFAVINNAGINILADVELATMEMYKRVAEVNIYGMIRVTKAFCPLIRKTKGRIINVTSVKGRVSLPLDSTYITTKWAGEAFSDILRRELIRFGVKVIIMEPGDFGGLTGMLSKETIQRMENDLNFAWNAANDNVKDAYGREYIDALMGGIKEAGSSNASSLVPVVDAMEDAVTNEDPEYRYLVDGSSRMFDKYCVFARLNPFLPEGLMDRLMPTFFPLPQIKQKAI